MDIFKQVLWYMLYTSPLVVLYFVASALFNANKETFSTKLYKIVKWIVFIVISYGIQYLILKNADFEYGSISDRLISLVLTSLYSIPLVILCVSIPNNKKLASVILVVSAITYLVFEMLANNNYNKILTHVYIISLSFLSILTWVKKYIFQSKFMSSVK